MNRAEFDKLTAATIERTAGLLIAKGAEYAGDGDRLANFKRNAEKNGTTVLECWQVYWGKHVDSINSYMARVKDEAVTRALEVVCRESYNAGKNGQEFFLPKADRFRNLINDELPGALVAIERSLSEPIEGRFDDNINYSILCQAILKELREEKA